MSLVIRFTNYTQHSHWVYELIILLVKHAHANYPVSHNATATCIALHIPTHLPKCVLSDYPPHPARHLVNHLLIAAWLNDRASAIPKAETETVLVMAQLQLMNSFIISRSSRSS